jgi:hypothetical protein
LVCERPTASEQNDGKSSSLQTQVMVGGGPVGMLPAPFLDRYGVKSVIFNTEGRVRGVDISGCSAFVWRSTQR